MQALQVKFQFYGHVGRPKCARVDIIGCVLGKKLCERCSILILIFIVKT